MSKKVGKQVALLVRADGTSEVVRPAAGNKFTLAELKGYVGGYIELVVAVRGRHYTEVYCNEEGKLQNLPINVKATVMAAAMGWIGPEMEDYLVGDVLIVGREKAQ